MEMVIDLWQRRADLTPNRRAVWRSGQWLTYADLNARANGVAAELRRRGVVKGDRVAILACNDCAHLDLIAAARKTGAIHTPFNYRWSPAEVRTAAEYVRPALIVHDEEFDPPPGVAAVALREVEEWAGQGRQPRLQSTPSIEAARLSLEDPFMLLFTGGTTGTLKAAVIPYRQDLANAASTIVSWNLDSGDCVIQATPMFHAAVNAFTMPLLHLGARLAIQRSFDPAAYLQMVRECDATILFLVPTMYKLLVQHPDFATADFSGIRWAISGGAACPPDVAEAFRACGVRFKQGYGLTEAGPNCFSMELDDAASRPQSIGKPILYTEAVLRDKNGRPVPRGETAELTLAGPHLASGYFERPAETAEAFRDGWLWTGDLAKQDDEGFFYISGRRKEMLISGGENVFPSEIEACLHQHPAVADCAVAGVADADWGEVGLAAIVLRPGQHTSADELREYLRGSLARYKVPKHFRFVEVIPKSGAGKVLRRDVARTL
jgi:fatty-acyl-CoA synthase